MLSLNETYTVSIEEMNIFGNGVCHIDSFVVFVFEAISGERCKIQITKLFSNYAYAKIIDIIIPSPNRQIPPCISYEKCGSCSFLHTKIEEENITKLAFVKATLAKNKIEADLAPITCLGEYNYRNKVVLYYGKNGFGYNEKSSINVIEHSNCLLNDKEFDEIAKFTASELKNTSIRALYLRKGNGIMVCPIFYNPTDIIKYATSLLSKFPNVQTVLTANIKDKDLALEKLSYKTIYGDGYITDSLCGVDFKISPRSFYQVNKDCAKLLYEKAIELLDAKEGQRIADLFCGTGTMGIIIAKSTNAYVYGVEIEKEAIKDAKKNAKINGVSNIEFFNDDASKFDKPIDSCIIDPPRKGCSKLMIETLLNLKPQKIVYVSCNPDTMCKDIKALSEAYTISSPVFTYNMFPRTTHVESVVCLKRQIQQ